MRTLRSQLISWLVYIAVLGLLMPGIDNFAHLGGFVSGFALGKLMIDRQPADAHRAAPRVRSGLDGGPGGGGQLRLHALQLFLPRLLGSELAFALPRWSGLRRRATTTL